MMDKTNKMNKMDKTMQKWFDEYGNDEGVYRIVSPEKLGIDPNVADEFEFDPIISITVTTTKAIGIKCLFRKYEPYSLDADEDGYITWRGKWYSNKIK